MRIRTRNERVALWAAACLVLAEGSSSNEVKKAEAPAAVKSEPAPNVSKVSLDTAKGPVILEVHRDWAPWGADHFYNLIKTGFYDGDRFFGVVRNFVVQFGINGDPKINRLWANANLRDDPVKQSNAKVTLTYATSGPNTRSTQLFIQFPRQPGTDPPGLCAPRESDRGHGHSRAVLRQLWRYGAHRNKPRRHADRATGKGVPGEPFSAPGLHPEGRGSIGQAASFAGLAAQPASRC